MRFLRFFSLLIIALTAFASLGARPAQAGLFELSMGLSFDRSNYTGTDYSWTRRWGASFAYNLTENSQVELSFQDVVDRTSIAYYEDTTFHDEIFGVTWVQQLLGKSYPIQPYVKVGIGQMYREASGYYALLGQSPPSEVATVTGILGGGIKIYLTRTFGLRGEATTYLTGGALSTWKDNFSATTGVSFYF